MLSCDWKTLSFGYISRLNEAKQTIVSDFCFGCLIFIIILTFSKSININIKSIMKSKIQQPDKIVHKLSNLISMKFIPTKPTQTLQKSSSKPILDKLKTSISWLNLNKKSVSENQSQINGQIATSTNTFGSAIKYVRKLTNEHYLLGNQSKVDAIWLGGVVEQFIDTQHIWSIILNKTILNLAVDSKKSLLAFLTPNQVHIYSYNLKKSKQLPIVITVIKINDEVKFIQFAKDALLGLFYENRFDLYLIDDNLKTYKRTCTKPYGNPQGSILFQVPQAFQSVVNIFFQKNSQTSSTFQLWYIELSLEKDEINISKALKVYEINLNLKESLNIQNYSKQIFFLNLGHTISAVKKGYVIDTVNSSIQGENSVLKYIGNDRLVHVTTRKIQIYSFKINKTVNPPRIILQSTDSIFSKNKDENYKFVALLQIFNQNLAVFYQIKEQLVSQLTGQIKYIFCLTQKCRYQDKINETLPSAQDLLRLKNKQISYDQIQQKCDMAQKMGLTKKQIYLRLWNRSTKSDVADYQFLLDTMDYNTIRSQIQGKLKKNSMVLREVIKIQQGCFDMLSKQTFSSNCNLQILKNYLISHFLLRKLKLYQKFALIQKGSQKLRKSKLMLAGLLPQKQQSSIIMINIQSYNQFVKSDLRAMLLDLINDYCVQGKQNIIKIRTLIKLFKFSFGQIYFELLQQIIKIANKNTVTLLQNFPQALPYEPAFNKQIEDPALFQGVWKNITDQQWEQNLYVGGISTIDNKEIVDQMIKSVWCRRNFLSLHDLIAKNKIQIMETQQKMRSQQTFYFFIQRIFQFVKDPIILQKTVQFIQFKYSSLPQHIIGNIFLYKALYDYFHVNKNIKITSQKMLFRQFLKLQDYQIFKLCFEQQKIKKNCILKQIKPLYAQLVGNDAFNFGLLNYFSSDLSQISDIKFLLNRLNNQKIQFHEQNQGLYEVIVKGMQAKLKLGSQKDIPIDEVIIYISNIHISQGNQIKADLMYLKLINQKSDILKKIKLNMSVFDIIKCMDKVITALVNYKIQEVKVTELSDSQQIISKVLQSIEFVRQIIGHIYFQSKSHDDIILFSVLTKLCETQSFILKVKMITESPKINEVCQIDQIFKENIVLYMYKWRYNVEPIYAQSQTYMINLVQLLPIQNEARMFIQYQVQLGVSLSCSVNMLQYPLGGENAILSTVQLQNSINSLTGKQILAMNFERIFQISLKMQQLSSDGKISSITLYQLYEIVVLRLIECRMLKECIPTIKKIFQINPKSPYNYIYPVILVQQFSAQLCDQNKSVLLSLITYSFQTPSQLLSLIQKLLTFKYSNVQQKLILKKDLAVFKAKFNGFRISSQVFDQDYKHAVNSKDQQASFSIILQKTLSKLLKIKDQFSRNPAFNIIFTILCNDPYVLSKYLYCTRFTANFKSIRCFLSFLLKQQIFDKMAILQIGKRSFKILYDGLVETLYIQEIIQTMRKTPIFIHFQVAKFKQQSNMDKTLGKSIERFKNKIKQQQIKTKRKTTEETSQQRKERIRALIKQNNPSLKQVNNDYPFVDSDNQGEAKQPKLRKQTEKQRKKVEFDPTFQRILMMSRKQKLLGMYISQEYQKKQKNLYYSQRNQDLQVKNSLKKLKNKRLESQMQYSNRLTERKRPSSFQEGVQKIQIKIKPTKSLQSGFEQNLDFVDLAQSQKCGTIKQEESQSFINSKISEIVSKTPEQVLKTILQSSADRRPDRFRLDSIIKENPTQSELDFLYEFIKFIYLNNDMDLTQGLNLIKQIQAEILKVKVNIEFLEMYLKMEHFQKKFSLNISVREMFPVEGLFLPAGSSVDQLFDCVKGSVAKILNQNNVYKISKVMSLVFKKGDVQQQLNVFFILSFLKQFNSSKNLSQKEQSMSIQKIKAFIDKIPPSILSAKDEQIINTQEVEEKRRIVIESIIETMKKKKNLVLAQSFTKKWIK